MNDPYRQRFQVRQSPDEPWRTVDAVRDNTEPETDRRLRRPVPARYVRLSVTEGDQLEANVARIYEFRVYQE